MGGKTLMKLVEEECVEVGLNEVNVVNKRQCLRCLPTPFYPFIISLLHSARQMCSDDARTYSCNLRHCSTCKFVANRSATYKMPHSILNVTDIFTSKTKKQWFGTM